MSLKERFEAVKDEFLKFENVENPEFLRRDLCAFACLDLIVSGKADVIQGAEHDQIWLITPDEKYLTDDQILFLTRCGVFCEDDTLSMFV